MKTLQVFRGKDELGSDDLERRRVGENMTISRFDVVMEKVEQTLVLIDKTADSARYMMAWIPRPDWSKLTGITLR